MSALNAPTDTRRELPVVMPPPTAAAALPDIPGGEINLLPVSALEAPLRIDVAMWDNSTPSPEMPERLTLLWDGGVVETRQFTQPVQPADRQFDVVALHLQEGVHQVIYRLMTSNQFEVESHPLILTVDRTPPELGANGGMLVFEQRVVDEGVTPEYLDEHGDRVQAEVPAYDTVKPGDVIHYYWDTQPDDDLLVDTHTVETGGAPILLTFTGNMIRLRGDGPRQVRYRVVDRAGNIGDAFARYAPVDVSASAPPRTFDWPNIHNSAGTGDTVTLDPDRALNGPLVSLPDSAELQEGDQVWVQWADPVSGGAYRTGVPTTPGGRDYRIPKDKLAFFIGRTVPVHYEVIDSKGRTYVSKHRQVRVLTLSGLPHIQVDGAAGTGQLSLGSVPESGATLSLRAWVFVSIDQCVTIEVDGVTPDNAPTKVTVTHARRLTAIEVEEGLGMDGTVAIPLDFLMTLDLHHAFRVRVWVSFDQGETWTVTPNFPSISIPLVP